MAKYRKKPIVIDAFRWHPGMDCPIVQEVYPTTQYTHESIYGLVWDKLHESHVRCEAGDWIITGINGEHYPCKPDVFVRTYELIEE